jgi:hypothetical protein
MDGGKEERRGRIARYVKQRHLSVISSIHIVREVIFFSQVIGCLALQRYIR